MKLDRGEFQVLGDILVFDFDGLLHVHAFEDLGCIGAAGDGRTAAKGLENSLVNLPCLFVYFDLEFHDIATGGGANEASAHGGIFLVEGSDIARVFVVVNHILVVCKAKARVLKERGLRNSDTHPLSENHPGWGEHHLSSEK